MANFLISTAGSLVTGTSENDLFVLNTALNVAAFGTDGADTITAGAVNATNGTLNGGQGADTISLTAGVATMALSKVFAGGGNDLIAIDAAAATNSTVNGGSGDDFFQMSAGAYGSTTINGNQGADTITASSTTLSAAFIGLGGGDDVFTLASAVSTQSSVIALGGGADTFSGTFTLSTALRVEGDTVGDTEFFGNDTIAIGGTTFGSGSLVQGGGGADVLDVTAGLLISSTINGNAGADSIVLSAIVQLASGTFVGGGAGADSIQVSAALGTASATIIGGGGTDVISVSGLLANTGGFNTLIGGADADTINVGQVFSGSSTNVGFAVGDSVVGSFDTVSALAINATSATYTFSQSAFSFASGQNLSNGDFTTNTGGVVGYINADANTLTARAAQMDEYLTVGQTVIFAAAGANYVFSQAGGTNSGTADDLVFQVSNTFSNTQAGVTSGGLDVTFTNSSYTINVNV